MSTETIINEFDDGSKIVTSTKTEIIDANGEPLIDAVEEIETIEPVADAAVQIAEIEAERDITIAAIQAETQQAAIEADENNGDEEWRRNIEQQLTETNNRLADMATLVTSLIPPQSPPVEPNPAETHQEDESGEATQASPEQAEESAPEPPKRAKKSRWI